MTDIDIDFPTTFDPHKYFPHAIRASMVKNGKLAKHTVGIYFQNIPVDKITGLAAIPYKQAEQLGYFKFDFLHISVLNFLDCFENKDQVRQLLKTNPDWSLLEKTEVVGKLFQLHEHYDILQKVKPKSVQELADVIALIRPGKRHLLKEYLNNRDIVRQELYRKTDNQTYYFKRSHAVAYAMTIILQLHLIKENII